MGTFKMKKVKVVKYRNPAKRSVELFYAVIQKEQVALNVGADSSRDS